MKQSDFETDGVMYAILDLHTGKFQMDTWHNIRQYLLDENLCEQDFDIYDTESWNTGNYALKIAVIEQYEQ